MFKHTIGRSFTSTSLAHTILISAVILVSAFTTNAAQSAWFERLVPKGETYTVSERDRDLAFVIDGFIYDARRFCYLEVGDRVVFFEGRHGIDYRATVYNLNANERCELLLRRQL